MKIVVFICGCVIFGIGLAIGAILDDIPFFTLERTISLQEVISLGLSIIALPVGAWLINKWLDEKRHVKDLLIDELRTYLKMIDELRVYIDARHEDADKTINVDDRAKVMKCIKNLERRLKSCEEQLNAVYKAKGLKLAASMKASHTAYWREMTDELLTEGKQFDNVYKKTLDDAHEAHCQGIKLGIIKLNSL